MYGSFYGWYLKCQSSTQTLAVIPAVHRNGKKKICTLQVITDKGAWMIEFSGDQFRRAGKYISIGENWFGEDGIRLAVYTPELTIEGKVDFGPLWPLKYDIMGPFSLMPFMECRHRVWSMRHWVSGNVYINGERYSFQNDYGYWEGDEGRSFPEKYLWTECSFAGGALMLSVAEIPMAGFHFTGIIGVVLWEGKEYRLATYLGAKVDRLGNQMIRIVQGNLEFEAHLLEVSGQQLKAPTKGDMIRTVHESAACRAFYRLRKKKHTLFEFETDRASFEYEYPL